MPVLLLIRHGENDYSTRGKLAGRLPGVHLNDRGRAQAQELAKALQSMPIKAVYTSPLDRAVETAQPIARLRGVPLKREAGLLEADIGDWQGHSVRRLALTRYWRIVQQAPSRATHPGGESFPQTQIRVVSALDKICAAWKPRDIVACVFHADPIKLAVAHYIGLPLDRFQRLGCDTGSVTMLAVGATGAQLIWLNRRPPFPVPTREKKS
jgi:probable phosphoglycerate mutase